MRIARTNILDGKSYDIPKTPISIWLMQQYQSNDIKQVEARYADLKKKTRQMGTRFLKFDLNAFGYYRLCKNMINEALSVFKINASQYPTLANTNDSLGEAYLKAGQKDEAIASYRKWLDLNPGNDNARAVLQTLVNIDGYWFMENGHDLPIC